MRMMIHGCRHRDAIAIGIGYRNRYRDVIGIGMLVVLVSRRYLIGTGISSVSVYDRYEVYNSSLCEENRCRNLIGFRKWVSGWKSTAAKEQQGFADLRVERECMDVMQ